MEAIIGTDAGEDLQGTSADDTIKALAGNDFLYGFGGDDFLYGFGGDDVLAGGDGDDVLAGGEGGDTYIFNVNGGNDVITDLLGANSLQFRSNELGSYSAISSSDFSISGYDLVISLTVGGYSQKVTITDYYREPLDFSISYNTAHGGTSYEILNDQLPVLQIGSEEDDILNGGEGNDRIDGGVGNDLINGGAGNDILDGGAGDDTYVFNSGDGHDIIYSDTSGQEALHFNDASGREDFAFERRVGDGRAQDVVLITITTNASIDSVTIKAISFKNGDYSLHYGDSNELLGNLYLAKDEGSKLSGGSDKDWLLGLDGDDILEGGAGDDFIDGGDGNDKYIFNSGDGHDIIYSDESGQEALYFNDASGHENFAFARQDVGGRSDDVIITIETRTNSDSYSDSVTIKGGSFQNGDYRVYYGASDKFLGNLYLADVAGDTLIGGSDEDWLVGLAGEDTIKGNAGDDILDGGAGNDRLDGGTGEDKYYFSVGDGNDEIIDADGGKIYFSSTGSGNYAASDFSPIRFTKNGMDLVIKLNVVGQAQHLTVKDYYSDTSLFNFHYSSTQGGDYAELDVANAQDVFFIYFGNAGQIQDSDENRPDMDALSALSGDDVLHGFKGNSNDAIYGLAGDDIIYGLAGDDFLYGGWGDDIIYGGLGDDIIDGGEGADAINGGSGADWIDGGSGNDWIYGGEGADIIDGGEGDDWIYGGAGADTIDGGEGADHLVYNLINVGVRVSLANKGAQLDFDGMHGFTSNNNEVVGDIITNVESIWGSLGDDWLTGDDENNAIYGDSGNDRIEGGAGDDYLSGSAGWDTIDGGAGVDTVVYTHSAYAGVRVSLANKGQQVDFDGTHSFISNNNVAVGDTITNIENIVGSAGYDWLTGDDNANTLSGAWGNDRLEGGAGDDLLLGGLGSDILAGGAGDDLLQGGLDNDILDGGAGDDTYVFENGDGGFDRVFDDGGKIVFLGTEYSSAKYSLVRGSDGNACIHAYTTVGADTNTLNFIDLANSDDSASGYSLYTRIVDNGIVTDTEVFIT